MANNERKGASYRITTGINKSGTDHGMHSQPRTASAHGTSYGVEKGAHPNRQVSAHEVLKGHEVQGRDGSWQTVSQVHKTYARAGGTPGVPDIVLAGTNLGMLSHGDQITLRGDGRSGGWHPDDDQITLRGDGRSGGWHPDDD